MRLRRPTESRSGKCTPCVAPAARWREARRLDPSVLVSALIGSATAGPGLLVDAWYESRFILVVSPLLIAELDDVLGRERFAKHTADGRGEAYIQGFARAGEHREDPDDPLLGFSDPDDEYLFALARMSDVDALVSLDKRVLEFEVEGVTALRPMEFLTMLEEQEAGIQRARLGLERLGIPTSELTDEQAVDFFASIASVGEPGPAVRAGAPPINARAWIGVALTVGAFIEPEDREQLADLNDGGDTVDLGVVVLVVMRHMSGSQPQGWTDEALAARVGETPEAFTRTQQVLDVVAEDVGRPASPAPRWWLRTESPR